MGAGIAVALALGSVPTTVIVRRAEAAAEAGGRIGRRLETHERLGLATREQVAAAEGRIETRLDLGGGPYDVVVETITEDLTAKRELLSRAEAMLAEDGVICSNTSSLAIEELAVAVEDPGRLAGWHWFHPADLIELVEIVPGDGTRPTTLDRLAAWSLTLGKTPIVLTRDTAGFVANRLQYALVREAYALVAEGVCSVADLDAAVTRGLGPRWSVIGPFATMDLAGLEVHAAVARRLFPLLSRRQDVPELLEEARIRGARGAEHGAGLRGSYGEDEAAALASERDRALAARLVARREDQ
jgi:3-hydroxybutyryl-CoA dehydrogenase